MKTQEFPIWLEYLPVTSCYWKIYSPKPLKLSSNGKLLDNRATANSKMGIADENLKNISVYRLLVK